MEKIAILGASSGFGRALALRLESNKNLFLSSRKEEKLKEIKSDKNNIQIFRADFSNSEDHMKLLLELEKFQPQKIIYCAGGGTYGPYESKKWDSHEWTFQINFLFPAKIIHYVLSLRTFVELESFIYLGSSVAENKADPYAASYAASKHAMKGLLSSLQKEDQRSLKIRTFSPPYMDTPMLPANAWPRQQGLVVSIDKVIEEFLDWESGDLLNYEWR